MSSEFDILISLLLATVKCIAMIGYSDRLWTWGLWYIDNEWEKLANNNVIKMSNDNDIKILTSKESYKYLDVLEAVKMKHEDLKVGLVRNISEGLEMF